MCVQVGEVNTAVTSNARAEHMAPQRQGEGGEEDWRGAIQAVLTDSLLQGFLKGPGAPEATLQTCC